MNTRVNTKGKDEGKQRGKQTAVCNRLPFGMQRTLDLDVTHITFYDKRRNINRKRRVLDL